MNTKTRKTNRSASLAIAIVVALLIGAVLLGLHRTLGLSDRIAFAILTVTGFAFCSTGMKLDVYGWKNPFNLFGAFLGVIILLLVTAVFTGLPFPGITSDRDAFIALAVLIALKVVLDLLRALAGRFWLSAQHSTLH
jgi:hypothetical protein